MAAPDIPPGKLKECPICGIMTVRDPYPMGRCINNPECPPFKDWPNAHTPEEQHPHAGNAG